MSQSEVRELFDDSINRILQDHVSAALLRAAEEGQWPAALHSILEHGGFGRALAQEEFGGVNARWSEVFPIVFACGRHALPLPLPENLAACWLLDRCGIQVPEGKLGIAHATRESALTRRNNGWYYSGDLPGTPWGRALDYVVASVPHEGLQRLLLLRRDRAQVTQDLNTAREARDTLTFRDAQVEASAPLEESLGTHAVHTVGALMRAAQMAGAMERIVALCLQYANDRIQFGKPIGKFQIIQQYLAVMASEAASVSCAAEYAFAMADQASPGFATACAKVRAGEAAGKITSLAHAIHGAIGFTYEHSLHFLTRRLWSWRSEFGTHAWWADGLGREACNAGGAGVWPRITSQQPSATD